MNNIKWLLTESAYREGNQVEIPQYPNSQMLANQICIII